MASHKNCVSETFEFSNSGAENLIRCGLTERNAPAVNTNRHTMVNCSQLNLVNSKRFCQNNFNDLGNRVLIDDDDSGTLNDAEVDLKQCTSASSHLHKDV